MNNSQQIVGADNGQAVIWSQTSGTWGEASLPNAAGGTGSQANAINNSNYAAGWTGYEYNSQQYQDAARWTYSGGSWTVTDLVNRNTYSLGSFDATAVNSSGTVVGWGQFNGISPTNDQQWLEWNSSGQMTFLGTLGYSQPNDSPLGINDSGVVVGYCLTTAGGQDACIYGLGGNNTVQDMNTAFASIIPSGWSLAAATAIDDHGNVIGYGNDNGTTEAFLIAPNAVPEPSTLLLMAAGLVGLLAYAWRKRK